MKTFKEIMKQIETTFDMIDKSKEKEKRLEAEWMKETDRIACMTRELSKMGADVEELPDGMVIRGRQLHGAEVESYGDHRIAMALAIAGLTAEGETVIRDAECASVTYPAFVKDFVRLGADFRLS